MLTRTDTSGGATGWRARELGVCSSGACCLWVGGKGGVDDQVHLGWDSRRLRAVSQGHGGLEHGRSVVAAGVTARSLNFQRLWR